MPTACILSAARSRASASTASVTSRTTRMAWPRTSGKLRLHSSRRPTFSARHLAGAAPRSASASVAATAPSCGARARLASVIRPSGSTSATPSTIASKVRRQRSPMRRTRSVRSWIATRTPCRPSAPMAAIRSSTSASVPSCIRQLVSTAVSAPPAASASAGPSAAGGGSRYASSRRPTARAAPPGRKGSEAGFASRIASSVSSRIKGDGEAAKSSRNRRSLATRDCRCSTSRPAMSRKARARSPTSAGAGPSSGASSGRSGSKPRAHAASSCRGRTTLPTRTSATTRASASAMPRPASRRTAAAARCARIRALDTSTTTSSCCCPPSRAAPASTRRSTRRASGSRSATSAGGGPKRHRTWPDALRTSAARRSASARIARSSGPPPASAVRPAISASSPARTRSSPSRIRCSCRSTSALTRTRVTTSTPSSHTRKLRPRVMAPDRGVAGFKAYAQKSKKSPSNTSDSWRMMPAESPAVMPATIDAPLVRPTR